MIVLVSLAQLVGTIHNICKIQGLKTLTTKKNDIN